MYSSEQLKESIEEKHPDTIISFGQRPKVDCIYYRNQAKKEVVLHSNYDISGLLGSLLKSGIKHRISENAGNYLCNHIHNEGLKYIRENELDIKMVFIHIPVIKNFIEFDEVKAWLLNFVYMS